MAGRFVDLKNTIPLPEMPRGEYQLYPYEWLPANCHEIWERAEDFKEFERYKDVTDPCDDEPCRFNENPTRWFFFKEEHVEDTDEVNYTTYSIYWALKHSLVCNGVMPKPSCIIFLLTDDSFAAGLFQQDELVESEVFHSPESSSSKSGAHNFNQKVSKALKAWDARMTSCEKVLVRCSYKNKLKFFEGKVETFESKYSHVPFETGKPSIEELRSVFDKVTRCEFLGTPQQALEVLKKQKPGSSKKTRQKAHKGRQGKQVSRTAQETIEEQRYVHPDKEKTAEEPSCVVKTKIVKESNIEMAGRLVDLSKTIPLLEMPSNCYWFNPSYIREILDLAEKDRDLERYEDGPSGSNFCEDTPYLFSPGANRSYFLRHLGHGKDLVYSVYRPLLQEIPFDDLKSFPIDCTIILMADGLFTGGVYMKGKLVATKQIITHSENRTQFALDVKNLLRNWGQRIQNSKVVFIRSAKEDKDEFFPVKGESTDFKYHHIPFETRKPSMSEIERVYDKLVRVEIHGSIGETLKAMKSRETEDLGWEEVLATSTNRQIDEYTTWPHLDNKLKYVWNYVEEDNVEGLAEIVNNHPYKIEQIRFLNSVRDDYGGGSVLQFAVISYSQRVCEFLLEIGCDPTIANDKGFTPLDYADYDNAKWNIAEIFEEFKKRDPENYKWYKPRQSQDATSSSDNRRKKRK